MNRLGIAQWASDGVPLCTALSDQVALAMVPDDAHGAIVAWDDRRRFVHAQHVDSSGMTQWGSDALAMTTEKTAGSYQSYPTIVADESGGAIVAWAEKPFRDLDPYRLCAQRMSGAGARLWGLAGAVVSAGPGRREFQAVTSDDLGNAVIVWADGRSDSESDLPTTNVYAQNVTSDGQLGSDGPTPTLLSLFDAKATAGRIELRWLWADAGRITRVIVERLDDPGANWEERAVERRDQGEIAIGVDRSVQPGRNYSYRLRATTTTGTVLTFGPLSVRAEEVVGSFGLSSVAPMPTSGPTRIEYTVPREASVRLSVVDLQGREVAILAVGRQRAGRHLVTWSGQTDRGRLRAGIYFVSYQTPAGGFSKRIVLAP